MQTYSNILNQAQGVAATPYQPFGGELVAGVNPQEFAGISNINAAQPWFPTATGMAYNAAQPIGSAQINQYLSPYTQDVINSTQAQFANMNAQQQQQVLGNAAAQGALGGNRVGIAQSELANQQQLAQAPVIAGLYNQGYSQALNAALAEQQAGLQGAYGVGNLAQAQLSGANAQIGAGTLEQQTQQQQDIANYQQYLNALAYPFQTTQWLAGIGTGVGSQMGGTTSGQAVTTAPPPSILGQLAGGLLGGAGLLGGTGAFGSSGWLTGSMKPAARGGRIQPVGVANYQTGGGIGIAPLYQSEQGPTPYSSLVNPWQRGVVPRADLTPGHGAGTPALHFIDQYKPQGQGTPSMSDFANATKMIKSGSSSKPGEPQADPSATEASADAGLEGGDGMSADAGVEESLASDASSGVASADLGLADLGTAAEGFSLADFLPLLAFANKGGRINGVAGRQAGGPLDGVGDDDQTPYQVADAGVAAVPTEATPVAAAPTGVVPSAAPAPVPTPAPASAPAPTTSLPPAESPGVSAPSPVSDMMLRAREATKRLESAGKYGEVKTTRNRRGQPQSALGAYGIMDFNLPAWSRAALGREVSRDEFLSNPAIQDQIYDHRMGDYIRRFGVEGAGRAWLGGEGALHAPQWRDPLGTSVGSYGRRFADYMGGAGGAGASGIGSGRVVASVVTPEGADASGTIPPAGVGGGGGGSTAPIGVAASPPARKGFDWSSENPLWMPIAAMGFGMAARAAQPGATFAGSLGEGGLLGTQAYAAAKRAAREEKMTDARIAQEALRLQQRANEFEATDRRIRATPHQMTGEVAIDQFGNPHEQKRFGQIDKHGNLIPIRPPVTPPVTTAAPAAPRTSGVSAGFRPLPESLPGIVGGQIIGGLPPSRPIPARPAPAAPPAVPAPPATRSAESPLPTPSVVQIPVPPSKPRPRLVPTPWMTSAESIGRQAGGSAPYTTQLDTPALQAATVASQPAGAMPTTQTAPQAPSPGGAPSGEPAMSPETLAPPEVTKTSFYEDDSAAPLRENWRRDSYSTTGFNMSVLDDPYFQQNPGARNDVLAMAQGRVKLPSINSRQPISVFLRHKAQEINPDVDENTFDRRKRVETFYAVGTQGGGGQQIVAFNRYLAHSASMLALAERLHKLSALGGLVGYGSTFTNVNDIVNALTERGYIGPTEAQDILGEWELNRAAVAGEGAKIFAGKDPSLGDREHWMKTLDPAKSFDTIKAIIGRGIELGQGALVTNLANYKEGLRSTADPREFLTPRTRRIIDAFEHGVPMTEAIPETAGPIKRSKPTEPAGAGAPSSGRVSAAERYQQLRSTGMSIDAAHNQMIKEGY